MVGYEGVRASATKEVRASETRRTSALSSEQMWQSLRASVVMAILIIKYSRENETL